MTASTPIDINPYAYERAKERLFTASAGTQPTGEQTAQVANHREAAAVFGALIEKLPAGRDKALAWTALEDTLMRANRAVFAPAVTAPNEG